MENKSSAVSEYAKRVLLCGGAFFVPENSVAVHTNFPSHAQFSFDFLKLFLMCLTNNIIQHIVLIIKQYYIK